MRAGVQPRDFLVPYDRTGYHIPRCALHFLYLYIINKGKSNRVKRTWGPLAPLVQTNISHISSCPLPLAKTEKGYVKTPGFVVCVLDRSLFNKASTRSPIAGGSFLAPSDWRAKARWWNS